MAAVRRLMEWYDPYMDTWLGKTPLAVPLAELQQLFGIGPDDPMYDMHPVRPEHVATLEQWTGQRICLDSYDYFVTAVEE
jgi:hypothetical protein